MLFFYRPYVFSVQQNEGFLYLFEYTMNKKGLSYPPGPK